MVPYSSEQMLVKIWSVDRKVKKLVAVNNFEDLKRKAVDEGVCHCHPDSNLKVFLEDGTEVEEEVFQCVLESSAGQMDYPIFIVTTEGSNAEMPSPSTSSTGSSQKFLEKLVIPWSCLPDEILVALQSSETLEPTKHQELVRMIATAMTKVQPRPSSKQCYAVADYVGKMYPLSLADPLKTASGARTFHGLGHKLETRIVNSRRGYKRTSAALVDGELMRETARSAYGCTEWQPPIEGINKEDTERAKKVLMDESLKSEEEQDLRLQEHLFTTFYASVRLTINTNGKRASDVQKEWPLLFTQHHFLAHFERLTSTRLRGLFSESSVEDLELLHAFFRHHVKTEESLQWLLQTDRAAREQSRPRALLIGLFPLMCLFFKEKIASLFCVVEASTNVDEWVATAPSTPVVLALGRSIFDCSCIVILDGAKFFEGVPFLAAMELLYAAYFCLNIKYSSEVASTLEFIQRKLAGMNPEEGTRQSSRKITSMHPKVRTALQKLETFRSKWWDCEALF